MKHCPHCGRPFEKCVCADFEGYQLDDLIEDMSYSDADEIVLTPFGGIGSEGFEAVRLGRKAILIELKESYFRILLQNMKQIESKTKQPNLFTILEDKE